MARDRDRPDPRRRVGEAAIRDMYQRFLAGRELPLPVPGVAPRVAVRAYLPPVTAPPAVLCDIDGVLQSGGAVGAALGAARSSGDHVLLSSGRPESRRGEIEAWLAEHMGVGYDALYLRRSADSRRTTDVKVEMFDEHIRERYRVRYALAGHHRSSEAWWLLGLAVFQVA